MFTLISNGLNWNFQIRTSNSKFDKPFDGYWLKFKLNCSTVWRLLASGFYGDSSDFPITNFHRFRNLFCSVRVDEPCQTVQFRVPKEIEQKPSHPSKEFGKRSWRFVSALLMLSIWMEFKRGPDSARSCSEDNVLKNGNSHTDSHTNNLYESSHPMNVRIVPVRNRKNQNLEFFDCSSCHFRKYHLNKPFSKSLNVWRSFEILTSNRTH